MTGALRALAVVATIAAGALAVNEVVLDYLSR